MLLEINIVFCNVIKIINFIKNNPLNSRLFLNLCEVLASNSTSLLMPTEIGGYQKVSV